MIICQINGDTEYSTSVFRTTRTLTEDGKTFSTTAVIKAADLPEPHKSVFLGFIDSYKQSTAKPDGQNCWTVRHVVLSETTVPDPENPGIPGTAETPAVPGGTLPAVRLVMQARHDTTNAWETVPTTLIVEDAPVVDLYNYLLTGN